MNELNMRDRLTGHSRMEKRRARVLDPTKITQVREGKLAADTESWP